jgi:NAD-dependent dihydropyrimidine dehydrogenase PreA subunit
MYDAYRINTLKFKKELCNNCTMCTSVCPHAVFARNNKVVSLVAPRRCMECGACQLNCPTGAISVESGVGCATAMIFAALSGKKEPTCGCN